MNFNYFQFKADENKYSLERKIMLLQENIRRQPLFAEAYHELAKLYVDKGKNLYQALELVNQALALEPDSAEYADTKDLILLKLKNPRH